MNYDGLMFSKEKPKKKRKKHGASILHGKNGTCYLCMMDGNYQKYPMVHQHHIFSGTANRDISEEHGLYCYLCPAHHEFGKEAVHQNAGNMRMLRKIAEEKFEEEHSEGEFFNLFRRYYK